MKILSFIFKAWLLTIVGAQISWSQDFSWNWTNGIPSGATIQGAAVKEDMVVITGDSGIVASGEKGDLLYQRVKPNRVAIADLGSSVINFTSSLQVDGV